MNYPQSTQYLNSFIEKSWKSIKRQFLIWFFTPEYGMGTGLHDIDYLYEKGRYLLDDYFEEQRKGNFEKAERLKAERKEIGNKVNNYSEYYDENVLRQLNKKLLSLGYEPINP